MKLHSLIAPRVRLKEADTQLMPIARAHEGTIKTWHQYVQFLRKFKTKEDLQRFLQDRNEATEDGQLIRLTITHFDAFVALVGYLDAKLSEAAKDKEDSLPDGESAGGASGDGEDQAEPQGPPPPNPVDLTISFNASRVRKYNKVEFTSDTGIVKKVTKDGLVVNIQPDQVEVFVNFGDLVDPQPQPISRAATNQDVSEGITPLVKKFFRSRV